MIVYSQDVTKKFAKPTWQIASQNKACRNSVG